MTIGRVHPDSQCPMCARLGWKFPASCERVTTRWNGKGESIVAADDKTANVQKSG